MKLSTIHALLEELEMRPSKSLGQNFLHDQNLAAWIVGQLGLGASDHLVEIGPGLGALSEFAIPQCASATLLEKDGRLAGYLKGRFPQARIEHTDALEFDVRSLFAKGPVKVLGNLPYYVTTPVLFKFTSEPSPAQLLVFTIQRELAERLSAKPSTKEYGALTLLVQRQWEVKYLRTLPGSVFTPVPKVDSAVIVLTPRPVGDLPDCDGALFSSLVKQGFAQRRKQLRKLLAPRKLDWKQLCEHLHVPETVRAEALSLRQWIDLTNFASPRHQTPAQDVHGEIFDIVDEHDVVTRQATRHEAHTQKLLHRAVHIFVFNRKGELFLQKRSRFKDAHPGRWDSSAAGHVNAGCDYAETASRELEEELGVSAPTELLAKINASERTGHEFVHLFKAQHEGPFHLPASEIETGGFFPIEVIADWIAARRQDFATGFIECWETWRRGHPKLH